MPTMRFKVDQKLAAPFARDGKFSFLTSFGRQQEDGSLRVISEKKCPVLTIPNGGIVQTSNEIAILIIAGMIVPTNTERNGKKREPGKFFSDVTDSESEYDLDLDPIFDSVEV